MDPHEVIEKCLVNNDTHLFLKFISAYVESIKTRRNVVDCLIHHYSQHYIDNNMWPTLKIRDLLEKLENTKPKDTEANQEILCNIFSILCSMKRRNYSFDQFSLKEVEKNELLYLFDIEYPNLYEFKETLNATAYGLMNIMQKYIISRDFETVRLILTHLISLKPKSNDFDVIDIICLFVESLDGAHLLEADMYKFWQACKDILYYQASKKKKFERVYLIYIFMYTITKNSLKNKKLLEESEVKSQKPMAKHDALFIIFEYDYKAAAEAQNLKNRRQPIEEPKIIRVENCNLINDGISKRDSVEVLKT